MFEIRGRSTLWQFGPDHDLLRKRWNGHEIRPKDQQSAWPQTGFDTKHFFGLVRAVNVYRNDQRLKTLMEYRLVN